MKQLSVGDKFWLLPAPINPLMVLVEVLEVQPNGYIVDEPVGLVNNDNCIYLTREEAEEGLRYLFRENIATIIPDGSHDLVGTREFYIRQAVNMRHRKELNPQLAYTMPLRVKQRGTEWFNREDL